MQLPYFNEKGQKFRYQNGMLREEMEGAA